MKRVGRIYGFVNDQIRVEWRRLMVIQPDNLKEPLKFGAILAVTELGGSPPKRYPAIDESIVCGKCNGSGCFSAVFCRCPKCQGIGRRAIPAPQKPRIRMTPGWSASPMSALFPHLGR